MAAAVNAQTVYSFTNDTITNAGTADLTTHKISGDYVIGIVVKATQISGTAAGTAVLQASLDNSTYASISTDTMTITNGATFAWPLDANELTNNNFLYYRVRFTGTGTQSTKVEGKFIYRQTERQIDMY